MWFLLLVLGVLAKQYPLQPLLLKTTAKAALKATIDPLSGWNGAYEVNTSPECNPCQSPNSFTSACSCPSGTIPRGQISMLNDCPGSGQLRPAQILGCFRQDGITAQSDFGGWYQKDAAGNCIVPNPYTTTSSCSCPTGATATTFSILSPPNAQSSFTICSFLSNPPINYAGAYHVGDFGACLVPNPFTGGCLCPPNSFFVPQQLRTISNPSMGSRIWICSFSPILSRQSVWNSAFEVSDPGCSSLCESKNPLTGGCTCPAGYTQSNSLRIINNCSGLNPFHGGNITACVLSPNSLVSGSDFSGFYQSIPSSGCVSPNIYTGGCNCSMNTQELVFPVKTDSSPEVLANSEIHVCYNMYNQPGNFYGGYMIQGNECAVQNPYTGSCTCPAGDPFSLELTRDTGAQSNIVLCYRTASTWMGAYEISDPGCGACNNVNPFTSTCTCPPGYIDANTIRMINDCPGPDRVHGSQIHGCVLPQFFPGNDFGGWFQSVNDTQRGCLSPNLYTGSCSCPSTTQNLSFTISTDTAPGVLVDSKFTMCYSNTKKTNFLGAYLRVDNGTCAVSNPFTGACSCSSYAVPLRVIISRTTGKGIGAFLYICSRETIPVSSSTPNNTNWMSFLSDSSMIYEINIPGTHDTFTNNMTSLTKANDQCQSVPFDQQLNDGIRFLDTRCVDEFSTCATYHANSRTHYYWNMSAVVDPEGGGVEIGSKIRTWLINHPTEFIVMRVKKEHSDDPNPSAMVSKMINDIGVQYWWTQNSWPTVGEARGKIVVLNNFNNSDLRGIPYSSLISQDNYNQLGPLKWNSVVEFFYETFNNIADGKGLSTAYINYASSSQPFPITVADYINPKLKEWFSRHEWKQYVGIVPMDFYDPVTVQEIYNTNFGISPKYFEIKNLESQKVLEIADGRDDQNENIQQWDSASQVWQHWFWFGSHGDALRNRATGMVMWPQGTDNGEGVVQVLTTNQPDARWTFNPSNGHLCFLGSSACADISNGIPINGEDLQMWDETTSTNNNWQFNNLPY